MSVAGKTREMAMTKDVLDHHLSVLARATSRASYRTMRRVPSCSHRVDRFKEPTRLDRYSRQLLRSLKSLAQGLA